MWQYGILTTSGTWYCYKVLRHIHKQPIKHSKTFKNDQNSRNLAKQTAGQSVSVLKYFIIPFFTESVFLLQHTKTKDSCFLHIFVLELHLPWLIQLDLNITLSFFPPSLFTLLASQRCGMMWQGLKKNIYQIPSFSVETPVNRDSIAE